MQHSLNKSIANLPQANYKDESKKRLQNELSKYSENNPEPPHIKN